MDVTDQPFFFGPADRQLFGCYHPPTGALDRNLGVVVCNPLGHEAIRAHRALRQLALRLARAGFAVLRFDYYATGDSAGDDEQGGVARWLGDIGAAVDRLKRESGVPRTALAGLRLGAALAALYGAAHREVVGLALWEPVVSGRQHLEELAALHTEMLWRFARPPAETAPLAVAEGPDELLGFSMTAAMRAELAALDLLALTAPPARMVLIVNRQAEPEAARLQARLAAVGTRVQHQIVAGPTIWKEDVDKALVPHATLDSLVAGLAEAAA